MSYLIEDQLNNIVTMIIEEYGPLLSLNSVSEIIVLTLENISGLETISHMTRIQLIKNIRNRYYEKSREVRRK